ncbi:MAG TPA: hypothetical protein VHL08_03580 [Dongiaceae bacterium]|nr:hypothetical protein [Dongiaceae bacterium]
MIAMEQSQIYQEVTTMQLAKMPWLLGPAGVQCFEVSEAWSQLPPGKAFPFSGQASDFTKSK